MLISLGAFDGSPASPPPAGGQGRFLALLALPLVAARAAGLAVALVAEVFLFAIFGEAPAGLLNQRPRRPHESSARAPADGVVAWWWASPAAPLYNLPHPDDHDLREGKGRIAHTLLVPTLEPV